MREKYEIRDKRGGSWYVVHNAIYDIPMSTDALALYNAIARYANNSTEKAYFSGEKFRKHHKIGKEKVRAAKKELIELGLIGETNQKTAEGASYFELLKVPDKIEPPGLTQSNPWTDAVQPPGLTQSTNNTNITKLKKTKPSPEGESESVILERELDKAIEYIYSKTNIKLKKDKWLKIWWYNAVKIDTLNTLKIMIKNFCESKINKELGKWDWITFFKVQAKRAGYANRQPIQLNAVYSEPDHGMTEEEYKEHVRIRDAI